MIAPLNYEICSMLVHGKKEVSSTMDPKSRVWFAPGQSPSNVVALAPKTS